MLERVKLPYALISAENRDKGRGRYSQHALPIWTPA